MNKTSGWLTGMFLVLALQACAKPYVILDRVLVENATASSITDVTVRHEPTRKFGAVNYILPQKKLDIGLPGSPMQADRAVVNWREGDGREWSVTVPLPYDRVAAAQGRPMSLVYTIYPAGHITAQLQDTAGEQ